MNKTNRIGLIIIVILMAVLTGYLVYNRGNLTLFNPHGLIADQQRNLILLTIGLSLLVIIPVFVLAFSIAWKYRSGNTAARYTPEWDHNTLLEAVWWGVPCFIILVLAVVTWQSTHTLDPYRPIDSAVKPLTVQVVALPWKWLFIYPEQQLATVNYVEFPAGTPINFVITADAPMNSFWIPELGGQIYAMPGMSTQLHLAADSTGSFKGSSANLSGKGFAGMRFTAEAVSQPEFDTWVTSQQHAPQTLDAVSYAALARASENNPRADYASVPDNLFNQIIAKYMPPVSMPAAGNR